MFETLTESQIINFSRSSISILFCDSKRTYVYSGKMKDQKNEDEMEDQDEDEKGVQWLRTGHMKDFDALIKNM